MENNHDIDKKFNEASKLEEPAIFQGFDKVWAQVEEKLDKKENKKRIIPIWFPYGIAASLIIGLGAFYFINKNEDSVIKKTAITQNTVSSKVNSSVQVIDSTVKSNIVKEINPQKEFQKPEVLVYDSKVPNVIYEMGHGDYTTDAQYIEKKDNNQSEKEKYEGTDGDGVLDKEDKVADISEVVVTGEVGIKKKIENTTSSITTVNSVQIQSPTSNVMQGRAEGIPIVAMGYSRNKNLSAPTISNIKNEFSQKNTLGALTGKVSGLQISPQASDKNILIRGFKSIDGNAQALFVVDGKISKENVLQKLDSNTIESIQVLKGNSATSIYGSKAANGVVIIKTKKLSRKERKAFKKLQKIEDSLKKAKFIEKQNNEEYDAFVENPFELTKNQSVSTFSIDVDKAAYSNIRRMINNGEMVDKNAVRIEEMINYFKYSYPQPKNDQPFSINTEYNESPWNPKHKLLKIGLQGKNIPAKQLPASNFVFLIDVSGSMDAPNKLPLLKSSFKVLLDQLRPEDKVGIVVYAGSAGMVLPPTSAGEKNKIIEALDQLQAGGSTAGGEGIELAYKLAQENFIKEGNNRVIIATDGDFNVGASSTGDLQTLVEEKRKSGIFLTCLGFGMGNFKDNRMETLANKGNGNYAYIDTMQEANKFLGKEFAGSMYAIAKDVKIQIEFNPKYVKSYRLIGYENRKLKNEDFTNDTIDAGELGSGHTVTALYEIIPVGVNSDFLPKETELKYSVNTNSGDFGDELATIKFRYKKPDGDKSSEIIQVVKNTNDSFSSSSDDFKFASSVAWFGLVLRNSSLIRNKEVKEIESLAKKGKGKDDEGYRAEFVRLMESYKTQQK